MGEAASRISDNFKNEHPAIEWRIKYNQQRRALEGRARQVIPVGYNL
jgi:hypothetical protein